MSATRVLVVEDERIVALNLKQRLTKLGYDISNLATSGAQALAEIEKQRPDVILMDVNIEGPIDGIQTAASIPEAYQIPVIYLTAYSEEATLERARTTRPYGFLLKPFSERELHATIQMVLERRRADVLVRENEQRLEALVEERTAEVKREVAERVKAEDALRQSQKMEAIGQLTGGIAHDFNNLLQGILGSLTLMKRSLQRGNDADVQRFIGSAESCAHRAAGLTHALLAFSRRQPLDPTLVDVNKLCTGMADLLYRTVGETIEVKQTLSDGLWLTRCDANQLDSAILNLALNARDAMPEGGVLTIETANAEFEGAIATRLGLAPGGYVMINVCDTGVGMTPETVSQAFEPFFTTKSIGQGTGLGLSMIYGFVRQSGGYAKIQSKVGSGTTVSLYLPKFDGEIAVEAGRDMPVATSASPESRVVLVVEDEPVVRNLVVEVLNELGHLPLEAADGPSGLKILQSDQRIDLLITDIGLPGLNGKQVADGGRIRRPDLKVLFMTGYAERAAAANGFLQPGMQLVTKPFTLDAIAARIQEIILS